MLFCALLCTIPGVAASAEGGLEPVAAGTGKPSVEVSSPGEVGRLETVPFEEPDPPPHHEAVPPEGDKSPASNRRRPRIAIIIDDMGYHKTIGAGLLALELNLSFSFLPHAPLTKSQEQAAYDKGRDILVHLPMEPKDKAWDPGQGALYTDVEPDLLAAQTELLLDMVPHAAGANNHMGSRFTENREVMIPVLNTLKKNKFFFVDSFTTAKSTALDEARKLGIPSTRRNIFLDNERSPEKVCLQLKKLVLSAAATGWAVGIGHPNGATLDGLRMCKEKHLADVEVVGIHQLVH